MRIPKTLFPYFLSPVILIMAFASNTYSNPKYNSIQKYLKPIKDTLPSNDSLDDKVFEKTDVAATVNVIKWRNYLELGSMKIIKEATTSGIKNGDYKIDVRFVIEKDGHISNVEAINNPFLGTKNAVERIKKQILKLIANAPDWTPAKINGENVRSYGIQRLTFFISR